MQRIAVCLSLAVGLLTLSTVSADARRLLQDGAIEAHVLDGDWCQDAVYVEVRAPTRDSFAGDAFQVRRIAAILTSILPLECPQARQMDFIGVVSGVPVWRGTAQTANADVVELPPPGPDDLVPINERQRVAEVQQSLNALGYDAGPADGVMGPRTRTAIQAYRRDRGAAPTTEHSADLVLALRQDLDPSTAMSTATGFSTMASSPILDATGSSGTGAVSQPSSEQIQQLAVQQNLPVINGRIAVPGGFRPPDYVRQANLRPILERLALRATPEIAANDNVAFALLDQLPIDRRRSLISAAIPGMTEQHRRNLDNRNWRLTTRDAIQIGLNEFEIQRILVGVRTEGLPRLIAEAPELPLPIVIVCGLSVENYDFAQQKFDLGMLDSCDGIPTATNQWISIYSRYSTAGFPTHLNMAPGDAERLRSRIEDNRFIYAGIEAAIAGIAPNDVANARFDLVIERERVVLYEDERLQTELFRTELGEGPVVAVPTGLTLDPTRIVVGGEEASVLSRHAALLALAAAPDMLDNDRVSYRYMELMTEPQRRQMTAQAGLDYDATLARASSVEGAAQSYMDEFGRRRLLQAFRSGFAPVLIDSAPALPLRILMYCDVSVDEYDFDRAMFPFSGTPNQICGRIDGLDSRQYTTRIPMAAMPDGIGVSLEDAPSFKDMHLVETTQYGSNVTKGRPTARLGIELSIVGVSRGEPTGGTQTANFEIETEGAVLFSAADPTRTAPILRFDLDRHDPAMIPAEPIAPPAIGEMSTVLLLMLRDGLFEPADQEWRQWAGARARAEERPGPDDAWPIFFGGMVDVQASQDLAQLVDDRLLALFQDWTRSRAANLPLTQRFVIGSWSITEEDRQTGRVPAFRDSSRSTNRDLAERLAVPVDRLHIVDLRGGSGWPEPVRSIAFVLPAPVGTFDIGFDPAAARGEVYTTNHISLEITNPRRMAMGTRDVLVVDATPVAARLVVSETGDELGTTEFDREAALPVSEVEFPPEGYLAVVHAGLTGADAVQTVYDALDYRLDAFERRQRAEDLVAAAQTWDGGQDGFWLVGSLTLAEYDFADQLFPASTVSLDDFARSYATSVTLYAADRSQFDVRMPPDEAREWQRRNDSHPRYALRARVIPADSPQAGTLNLTALEFELLADDEVLSARDPSRVLYAAVFDDTGTDGMAEIGTEVAAADDASLTPDDVTPPVLNSGELDILGIALGDTLQEAVETVAAGLDDPETYRADRSLRSEAIGANLWDPFNEGIMIREADASEAIMLYHEPPAADGQVTAVARWINFDRGSGPPAAAVRNLLIEKYGEPGDQGGDDNVIFMSWYPEGASRCPGAPGLSYYGYWQVDTTPWSAPDGPVTFAYGTRARCVRKERSPSLQVMSSVASGQVETTARKS